MEFLNSEVAISMGYYLSLLCNVVLFLFTAIILTYTIIQQVKSGKMINDLTMAVYFIRTETDPKKLTEKLTGLGKNLINRLKK